jgi:hypothetical protein
MKEFGKILGLTLGFGILAVVLASIPSRPVAQAAGSAPVIVTNTPAQAVPVSQTGTWNVGITGTPTVGLANGSTVGINNTATTPVLVRDVDNAARHAIQSTLSLIVPDVSDSASGTVFAVPAGERLVIESVSIEADAPSGQKVRARITASLSGNVFWFPPLTLEGSFPVPIPFTTTTVVDDVWAAHLPARIYASAGTPITFTFERQQTASGPAFATITISGYLVDLP